MVSYHRKNDDEQVVVIAIYLSARGRKSLIFLGRRISAAEVRGKSGPAADC